MDIRQLRYFVALAEELHFRRAAERLHIAQPALSQQIRGLERELGLQLLERTNRRVSLTDAGARLLTEATAVIARFDEAVANMQRVRVGELGTLRIGVFPGPLRQLLPDILAELRRRNPDVDVATRYLPALDQVTAVLEGRLDLALLPSLLPSRTPAPLAEKVIDRQPLGLAVPAGHALARKRRLEPRDLAGLPLVWMARASDPSVYDSVLAALTAAGVTPLRLVAIEHGFEELLDEELAPLDGLEIGVAGITHALSSIGCLTAASCRSHNTAQSWSDCPVVFFAAPQWRVELLAELIAAAGCGLRADRGMLSIVAPSILHMHALGQRIVRERKRFRRKPDCSRTSLVSRQPAHTQLELPLE